MATGSLVASSGQLTFQRAKSRRALTRGHHRVILSVRTRNNLEGIPMKRGGARREVSNSSVLITRRRKNRSVKTRKEGGRRRSVRKRNENSTVVGTGGSL